VTDDTYSSNVLIAETTGVGSSDPSTSTYDRDPASLLPIAVEDGNNNATGYSYQTFSGAGGTEISSSNVLSVTDGQGNTTSYEYNADNQVWCSIDAADNLNGAACPTSPPTSPPSPGSSDPNLGVTINYYNSNDQLTATTDALGNTTTYNYTSGVSGVPNGLLYCTVDPASYQESVSCPAYGAAHVTGTTTAAFDSAGDTTATTNAVGDTTMYNYALASTHPGLVSSEVDADSTTTTFTYNGAGEFTSKVVTFGSYSATTLYAYDAYGRLYCEVTPLDAANSVTCPSSAPSSPPTPGSDSYLGATITTYDADGHVVQVTNPLGGITYYAYDEAGELFCTVAPVEAAASVTCSSSAPSSPPDIGSDSYLGATIDSYDAAGRLIQVTNPLGGIIQNTYDGAGSLLTSTVESNNSTSDPNVETTYTYDADDRVLTSTVSAGSGIAEETQVSYDPNGNVFCTVSPNASEAGGYQCPAWQPSWIVEPPSPTSLYSTSPTSAQANDVTTDFYNANGNLEQSTNPDVETTVYAVDADGRTYCASDPVNVATYLSANPTATYPYLCPTTPPTSAPSTGSDPGYDVTIYDAAGNVLSSSNPLGDTTSYSYDGVGNVLTTSDPRGEVTTNCYYDENGTGACAHSAPSAGGSGGDLYSTKTPDTTADPSGEITTDTYFPGDEPETTTTPSSTATYSYDDFGDLLSTTYSAVASGYATPATTSATFNVDGTEHTMTDASGTTTYGYDAMGDVTSQALVATSGSGLSNATTSYSYFTTGVLATLTYPAYAGSSDPVVSYAYDSDGAMISSTDWLGNEITYNHDLDGNETAQDNDVSGTYPSGTSSTAFTYDAADNDTVATSSINQTCGSSENLTQSFSGTSGSYNEDAQLTESTDSYSDTCSGQTSIERNYSYDIAGDVIYQGSVAQGSSANDFAFDASGDPTTISSHDGSGNFDTYTQTFDAAGEPTGESPVSGSSGVSSTYTYDTLGDQIKDASTTTSTYGYNAAGQMVSVTSPSGSTTYLYNGDGLDAAALTSHWSDPIDIDSTRAVDAVTCTSATFCVAVGASGYAAIFNGTSWSAATDADSTRTMDAVSCVSSTFCVAVDTAGYETTYNGTSWSTPTDIDSTRSVDAVTCTSTSFCVAVGASGYASTYNGTSWASASDVDSTRTIDAVTCTSSTFCYAVDTSGYATKYTGSWASASDIDSSRSIDTISCYSSSLCVAAGASGYAAIYNGSSWATATDVDSTRTIKFVACPSSTLCVAVDALGYATTYNGTSWATATDIDGSTALNALNCTSADLCTAGDASGSVLSFNGYSWSGTTSVDGTRSISSISCPTSSFCVAAGVSGYATDYSAATPIWSTPSDIDSTRSIDAVTCTSSTFCVAVDTSGYETTFNGTSWSTPSDIDSTRSIDAVSCTSSTFCVAVDTSGYETTFDGTTWSTPSDIDSTRSIDAVTCVSSSFCVAAGASGYDTIYNGSSWSTPADIDSTRTVEALSCVSSSFCVAVGTSGYDTIYNGTSWSTPADIDSSRTLDTVSCYSSSLCAAADTSGYAATYNGTSWATATDADSSRSIKSVLCPSSTLCVAVDGSGYSTTFNGTSWSTPADIDGSTALKDLSCPSATLCVTSDASGNALTFNGTSWSDPTNVDSTRTTAVISCPSTTFCVVSDTTGYATFWSAPAANPVSQLTWDTTGSLGLILSDGTYDYLYGPGATPVEEINLATGTPTFLTYTPADSTWLSTNAAGDETGFYGYDAFGNLAFGTPTSAFGYAGQYRDAASGFSDMRARFYDSQNGTFSSRDPDFDSTDAAYNYADADPVNRMDPTGLWSLNPGQDIGEAWNDAAGGLSTAADATGHFLSDPSRWRAEGSFWAGVGNFGVSSVQLAAELSVATLTGPLSPGVFALEHNYIPGLGIANPYCADSDYYTAGEWFGAFETMVATIGAGLAGGSGAAATGSLENNATVSDLRNLTPGNSLDLNKLATVNSWSDDQLLAASRATGDTAMGVNSAGDTLINGVTRSAVLMQRAEDAASSISWEDEIHIRGFDG
jgi:RHS repeat-associated protein